MHLASSLLLVASVERHQEALPPRVVGPTERAVALGRSVQQWRVLVVWLLLLDEQRLDASFAVGGVPPLRRIAGRCLLPWSYSILGGECSSGSRILQSLQRRAREGADLGACFVRRGMKEEEDGGETDEGL